MTPIAYTKIDIPGVPESDCREGFEADGTRWWLADRESDVAYGSLSLPTTKAHMDRYAAWDKDDPDYERVRDPEWQKLFAHIAPQSDVIYAATMDRLIGLIERIRDPRPPRKPAVQLLYDAGFVHSERDPDLFQLDIGKGRISVYLRAVGVKAEYHGNSPWHLNMFAVKSGLTTIKGDFKEFFWPEEYGDIRGKSVEYLIDVYIPWVRANRITRNRKG